MAQLTWLMLISPGEGVNDALVIIDGSCENIAVNSRSKIQ